jgi:predicted nucleic acid-binding protein
MVIVDTSVWIDYLNNRVNPHTAWLESALSEREIGLTSLSLCEVLQGISSPGHFQEFRHDLLEFAVFETGSTELAIASAENYRTLRRQGFTIRTTIDCIIATFCIEAGHLLLHRDRDFDAFETHLGLKVVHPPATTLI